MITELQRSILEFAKHECFKCSLEDFISRTGVDKDEAMQALKDLRSKRIVSMPPDLLHAFIGVTNYGWNVMQWKRR